MIVRLAILILFGIWIWIRSVRGVGDPDDVLPTLMAFPMVYMLGAPWRLKASGGDHAPRKSQTSGWTLALILTFVGIVFDWVTPLAVAWGVLAYQWITAYIDQSNPRETSKLVMVAIMGFPWIFIDFAFLGWWFRLSAAWLTGEFFQLLNFEVLRDGTALLVDGVPIGVEAACSGLNSLQMLMVAGFFLNYLFNRHGKVFWWNTLLIVSFSWFANTLRVITLSVAALSFGAEFASGSFHSASGLLVVGLMLLICWPIMSWQRRASLNDTAPDHQDACHV